MHPFYADYLERLEFLHAEIGKMLDGLPPEALDWQPGPEMNSLAVLAVHTAGAERYWIGDVAGLDLSDRHRDAEFQTRGLDAAELQRRLANVLEHSRGVLEGLALDDLAAEHVSPRDKDRKFTVAWALLHALEHAASHLGHMQITRQLWEQRAGR